MQLRECRVRETVMKIVSTTDDADFTDHRLAPLGAEVEKNKRQQEDQ